LGIENGFSREELDSTLEIASERHLKFKFSTVSNASKQSQIALVFQKVLRRIDYYVVDVTPLMKFDMIFQKEISKSLATHLSTHVYCF
jgi:hypothetical protein